MIENSKYYTYFSKIPSKIGNKKKKKSTRTIVYGIKNVLKILWILFQNWQISSRQPFCSVLPFGDKKIDFWAPWTAGGVFAWLVTSSGFVVALMLLNIPHDSTFVWEFSIRRCPDGSKAKLAHPSGSVVYRARAPDVRFVSWFLDLHVVMLLKRIHGLRTGILVLQPVNIGHIWGFLFSGNLFNLTGCKDQEWMQVIRH